VVEVKAVVKFAALFGRTIYDNWSPMAAGAMERADNGRRIRVWTFNNLDYEVIGGDSKTLYHLGTVCRPAILTRKVGQTDHKGSLVGLCMHDHTRLCAAVTICVIVVG